MTGRVLTILLMATGAWALAASPPRSDRVLAFTRTTGYRHDSIRPALTALQRAGAPLGIAVDRSEAVARLTPYQSISPVSSTLVSQDTS